jgi:predicted DNA-binding transcriptional regulator AlpA
MAHTNYSKSKIYRLIHEGKFPKQANKLDGTTSAGWFEDQILAYLEALRPKLVEGVSLHVPDYIPDPPVARKNPKSRVFDRGSFKAAASLEPNVDVSLKWTDTSLILIGKSCDGSEMFLHKPSRQILAVVGTASVELLRKLG